MSDRQREALDRLAAFGQEFQPEFYRTSAPSEADLDAIRARLDASKGWPWIVNDSDGGPPYDIWHTGGPGGPVAQARDAYDVEFIVNAHNDIAYLLSALSAARARADQAARRIEELEEAVIHYRERGSE